MIVEPLLAQNKYIHLCLLIIIFCNLYLTYLFQNHQIPLRQKNCPLYISSGPWRPSAFSFWLVLFIRTVVGVIYGSFEWHYSPSAKWSWGPSWPTEKIVMESPIFQENISTGKTLRGSKPKKWALKQNWNFILKSSNASRELFKSGLAIIRHYARPLGGD